jgi:hypothetical protein
VEAGVVRSVSVVVDVDRLLDDEGSFGAEKVLDTVEIADSCESGKSCLRAVAAAGAWAMPLLSDGAIDKQVVFSRADAPTYAVSTWWRGSIYPRPETSDSSDCRWQNAKISKASRILRIE